MELDRLTGPSSHREDTPHLLRETARYLRAGSDAGAAVQDLISRALDQIRETAQPRCLCVRHELQVLPDDELVLAGLPLRSHDLSRNLAGCTGVLFFAETLGREVDRLIRRTEPRDLLCAAALHAAAAAWIEACIDDECDALRIRFAAEGMGLRPRYSPGFGDVPLTFQRDFFRILRPEKAIGITLTESCLMIPSKSVTALIGLYPDKGERS